MNLHTTPIHTSPTSYAVHTNASSKALGFSAHQRPASTATFSGDKRNSYTGKRDKAYNKAKKVLFKGKGFEGFKNRFKAYRGENWAFGWQKLKEGFRESDNWFKKIMYIVAPILEFAVMDFHFILGALGTWTLARAAFPVKAFCWSNASRDFSSAMHIAEAMHQDEDFAKDKDIQFLTSHLK